MGLFGLKKAKELAIAMPIAGEIIQLEKVPDEMFSTKMMGDGFAIVPSSGEIFAPVAGEVVTLFPTLHAIGMKTKEGVEILIHFGMDTVNLKGEGFIAHVEQGDVVEKGEQLVSVDLNIIKDKVPSLITPIIFTNTLNYKLEIEKDVYGKVYHSKEEVLVLKK